MTPTQSPRKKKRSGRTPTKKRTPTKNKRDYIVQRKCTRPPEQIDDLKKFMDDLPPETTSWPSLDWTKMNHDMQLGK